MNLRINGNHATLPHGQTLEACLASMGLDLAAVVAELNETIVPREHWSGLVLSEGDSLEIVTFVGGG